MDSSNQLSSTRHQTSNPRKPKHVLKRRNSDMTNPQLNVSIILHGFPGSWEMWTKSQKLNRYLKVRHPSLITGLPHGRPTVTPSHTCSRCAAGCEALGMSHILASIGRGKDLLCFGKWKKTDVAPLPLHHPVVLGRFAQLRLDSLGGI